MNTIEVWVDSNTSISMYLIYKQQQQQQQQQQHQQQWDVDLLGWDQYGTKALCHGLQQQKAAVVLHTLLKKVNVIK